MAYFANGSFGRRYIVRWCERCTNWKDLDDGRGCGCPVWDTHLMLDYNAHAQILDMFIPMDKDGVYAEKCTMFNQIVGEIEGQTHLDFKETKL